MPDEGAEYSKEDIANINQVLCMAKQIIDRMKGMAVDLLGSTMQSLAQLPNMSQDSFDAVLMPAQERMKDLNERTHASSMAKSRLATAATCQLLLPADSFQMMARIKAGVSDVRALSSLMGCVKNIVPAFSTSQADQ